MEEIGIGQTVRVLPGEAVPVDGRVVSGETSIDQSVITGESMPVDKAPGDEVFSGTVNQMGAFDMLVEKTSGESSFQRLVGMVESVDADKTRMVRIADRWATRLVALVLALALATYIATGDVYRAVTVMIVFCPCAFILATPTAVVAAIGNLAKRGALVRDGDALERMSQVDTVAFDKTGTVTEGRPKVVWSDGSDRVLSAAASAESMSEHPLAKALVAYARSKDVEVSAPGSFRMTVGRGVEASVDGESISIGSQRMMEESGITIPEDVLLRSQGIHDEGGTVVFVSIDGGYAGCFAFSDTIRGTSEETVSELRSMGVGSILLTGDNFRAASRIAAEAGIGDVKAECRPEDKMSEIDLLQSEGRRVCMVGDGVNDAPALKKAWVGIAMGATGSDMAAEASDIVLVKDGLDAIPHLAGISRRMMAKVRLNIGFSLCWNALAVAMSMAALLTPVTGALVHNIGSVFVVVNSALLLLYGGRAGR